MPPLKSSNLRWLDAIPDAHPVTYDGVRMRELLLRQPGSARALARRLGLNAVYVCRLRNPSHARRRCRMAAWRTKRILAVLGASPSEVDARPSGTPRPMRTVLLRAGALARLRLERGWTRRELARHAGISANTLAHWEYHARQVSAPLVRRVADALGVPLSAIAVVTEATFADPAASSERAECRRRCAGIIQRAVPLLLRLDVLDREHLWSRVKRYTGTSRPETVIGTIDPDVGTVELWRAATHIVVVRCCPKCGIQAWVAPEADPERIRAMLEASRP